MENRRQFIRKITGFFSGAAVLSGGLFSFLKPLYGREANMLLAKDYTGRSSNASKGRVRVTPLNSFGVMGETNIKIARDEWRLEIMGNNGRSLSYTYDEIIRLPSFERKVVLTCPGFFENHGLWKGFSIGSILYEKGMLEGVKQVEVSGLNGRKEKQLEFPVKSILNDHVFLAYGVNRETLPVRNGFPLRVVAQDYMGSYWIKYVNRITLV